MAGRKRTGTLIWTGKQWSVRFAGGKSIPLETNDKRVAKARQRALASDPTTTAPTTHIETFEEAARIRLERATGSRHVTTERESRLRRWAFPLIGKMLVTEIKPGHITSVLEHVAGLGRSSTTLTHMRGDLIWVLGRLVKEEILTRNPARGELVDTPAGTDDLRPRVLLRDEEFVAFVEAPTTPPQLRMMAIVSRAFGGMRTSDLRAWAWEHVDLASGAWEYADVPRPKTSKKRKRQPGEPAYVLERLALPPLVAAEVRAWWEAAGRPAEGPVFAFPPARKSFAADLRAALLAAGVDRRELHHDTDRTKRVDFHSFRRAWSTAIGAAGLNAQTAMKVTGHRQLSTHMRYVRPEVIGIPSAAIPIWATPSKSTSSVLECPPGAPPGVAFNIPESLLCEGEDSNLHGSYPASTSSRFDLTRDGTFVHQSEAQPLVTTVLIEPNQNAFAPRRDRCGQDVVDLKLSFPERSIFLAGRPHDLAGAEARAADAALRAYLTELASSIGGALRVRTFS